MSKEINITLSNNLTRTSNQAIVMEFSILEAFFEHNEDPTLLDGFKAVATTDNDFNVTTVKIAEKFIHMTKEIETLIKYEVAIMYEEYFNTSRDNYKDYDDYKTFRLLSF